MIQFEVLMDEGRAKAVYCFECQILGVAPSVFLVETRQLRLHTAPEGGYVVVAIWRSGVDHPPAPIKPTPDVIRWALNYYKDKLDYIGEL